MPLYDNIVIVATGVFAALVLIVIAYSIRKILRLFDEALQQETRSWND